MIYKTKIKNGNTWTEVEIVTQEKIPSKKDFETEFLNRFGTHTKHKTIYFRNSGQFKPLR